MAIARRLVWGTGVNDADYEVGAGGMRCDFYRTWKAMLRRCYSAKYQARAATYIGCTVAPEWMLFSAFKRWMEGQRWEGNQLDKDILVSGNKVYSPDTCVFISGDLNKFILAHDAGRGEWPIGVAWNKHHGKFQSSINLAGKQKHLGYFSLPKEAHEAWRAAKHAQALVLAAGQIDQRIAAALSTRFERAHDA